MKKQISQNTALQLRKINVRSKNGKKIKNTKSKKKNISKNTNNKYCIKRPFSVRDTTSVIIVCILRSINIHSLKNKRIVKIIILNNLLISRYQSFFNQGFLSFFLPFHEY